MESNSTFKEAINKPYEEFIAFSQQLQQEYGSWSKYLNLKFDPENFVIFLFKNGANELHLKHVIDSDPALLWTKNNNTLIKLVKHLQDQFDMQDSQRLAIGGKVIDFLVQKDPLLLWNKDSKDLSVIDYLITKDLARFSLIDLNSKEIKKAITIYIEKHVLKKENLLEKILNSYQDKPHSSEAKFALEGKIKLLIECGFCNFTENQKYAYELGKNESYWQNTIYNQFKSVRDYMDLQMKLDFNKGDKKVNKVKI